MFSGWGLSWAGWLDNRRGEWWLAAQLVLITAHLLPVWPAPAFWGLVSWPRLLFGFGLFLLALGLIRAVQSLLSLGASLSPLPVPKHHNQLIRTGVYSHCRHPMYQAVLICSLGVVLATGSLVHLGLLLALAVVLAVRRGSKSWPCASCIPTTSPMPPQPQRLFEIAQGWTGDAPND